MSDGQWRVFVLLLILLGLELLRSQAVGGFFKATIINPLGQGTKA